jgi:sulfur relay (sulfurtransferase) complex TusBCD TusD component (DsrE family)
MHGASGSISGNDPQDHFTVITTPSEENMKPITMILGSPPYSGQDVDTVLGIAQAALDKGHRLTVVGSGDGTYGFLKGQRASGAPNAEKGFADLIAKGARIDL